MTPEMTPVSYPNSRPPTAAISATSATPQDACSHCDTPRPHPSPPRSLGPSLGVHARLIHASPGTRAPCRTGRAQATAR